MFAIGCATTDERAFRAGGAQTMQILDEGSSLLLRRHRYDSIDRPYNEMLASAATRDDLEAMVLVHQDAVVDGDGHVLARVRRLLAASPDVAVLGSAEQDRPREVEAVGGTLLVLSAWAVRNLRFDPQLGGSIDASAHDISLQARASGRRVVGAPLGLSRAWRPAAPAEQRSDLSALASLRRKWDLQC